MNIGRKQLKENGKIGRQFMINNLSRKIMVQSFVKDLDETIDEYNNTKTKPTVTITKIRGR